LLTNNTEESKSPPKKRKAAIADAASPRKKQKTIQMELDKPHPEPANWRAVYEKIEKMRSQIVAPVDTMGCHMPMLEEGEPRVCLICVPKDPLYQR
jgi:endonuclease III